MGCNVPSSKTGGYLWSWWVCTRLEPLARTRVEDIFDDDDDGDSSVIDAVGESGGIVIS